jgi:hypothetical protein
MGAGNSTMNPAAVLSTLGSSSPQSNDNKEGVAAERSKEFMKAIEDGKLVFSEDVFKNVQSMKETLETFSKDDATGLYSIVKRLNLQLDTDPNKQISPQIAASLESFHKAVIEGLESQNKDVSDKSIAFQTAMKDKDNIFKTLNDSISPELQDKKNKILQDTNMEGNKDFASNLGQIVDNITKMKVKYKFFEYKYIELNLFVILLIQHIYGVMDKFVNDVFTFNKLRDENRQEIMKKTVQAMVEIMTSANLQIEDKDFDFLQGMMAKLSTEVDSKGKALEKEHEKLVLASTEDIKTFVNNLAPALKTSIFEEISRQKMSVPSTTSTTSSFGGQKSNKKKSSKQTGGFVRDLSRFPQAFYELDSSPAS